jgi:alpha-L-fucosidase
LPDAKLKIKGAKILGSNTPVKFTKQKTGITISTEGITPDGVDTIIVVEQA